MAGGRDGCARPWRRRLLCVRDSRGIGIDLQQTSCRLSPAAGIYAAFELGLPASDSTCRTVLAQRPGSGPLAHRSRTIVGLLHQYAGRGPTRARTTIGTTSSCASWAPLTKGEQTVGQDGKHEVVLHSRRAFQDTMQADAITAVQELTGRRVVGVHEQQPHRPRPRRRGVHPRAPRQRRSRRSECRRSWSRSQRVWSIGLRLGFGLTRLISGSASPSSAPRVGGERCGHEPGIVALDGGVA